MGQQVALTAKWWQWNMSNGVTSGLDDDDDDNGI
jgi:hypothetical protein